MKTVLHHLTNQTLLLAGDVTPRFYAIKHFVLLAVAVAIVAGVSINALYGPAKAVECEFHAPTAERCAP